MLAKGIPAPIIADRADQGSGLLHGWVQSGVLNLPNGATVPWAQPDASCPDTAGACYRFKKPGTPDIVRTPEQLAAAAAAGKEWRNEVVLSGSRFQMYRRELDGWLYADPDGRLWLVRCPAFYHALHSIAAPLSTTLTLSLFGDTSAAAQTHTYPLVLADWGQAGTLSGLVGMDPEAAGPQLRTQVDAVRSDGGAALVMIHVYNLTSPKTGGGTVVDALLRHPLGWLEITISGPGASATVGIAVKKTRLQTLYGSVTPLQVDANTVVGISGGEAWSGLDEDAPGLIVATGENGVRPFVYTYVAEGDCECTLRRLLSIQYASDGSLIETELRTVWSATVDYPMPTSSGGSGVVTWSRNISASSEWSIALLVNGAEIGSESGSWAISGSESATFDWSATPNISVATPSSMNAVVTFNGVPDSISYDLTSTYPIAQANRGKALFFAPKPAAPQYGTTGDFWPGGTVGDGDVIASWILYSPGDLPEDTSPAVLEAAFRAHLWLHRAAATERRGGLVRQSPQVIGMRVHIPSAGTWTYGPAATPSGAYGSPTTRPFIPDGERPYASRDAYSGQVRWLNSTPVCWV